MMSHRVKAINDDLRMLGDDYRFGRIVREEYRQRRRRLLTGDSDNTSRTARKPLTRSAAETQKHEPVAVPAPTGLQHRIAGWSSMMTRPRLAIVGAAALVLVILAFWVLHDSHDRSSTPISAAESGQTAALEALATHFVDDNRWDAPAIEAFLQAWRAADAGTRKIAGERPAFARLREQITYNERVAALLLEDSAPGSGKIEQARALQKFDQELGGVR